LSTAFFVGGVEQTKLYLRHHPDLTAIFYLLGASEGAVEKISLQSAATHPRLLVLRAPQ